MSSDKMNSSNVYEMFEEVKELGIQIKDKLMQTPSAPVQGLIDVSAVTDLAERLEIVIEEVRKPIKTEHRHILRKTISQYRNNDLKYRYIKMQGKTDEEKIYCLENQFKYKDSIKIIGKQVKEYEDLLREQIEKIERAKQNREKAERLQREADKLKN